MEELKHPLQVFMEYFFEKKSWKIIGNLQDLLRESLERLRTKNFLEAVLNKCQRQFLII